jgi:uncharacterized protein YndB with AHSA1/START domain
MDHYVTLGRPVAAVFEELATPARLGDWLTDVLHVDAEPAAIIGVGMALALTVREGGTVRAVEAEVIGYEPPWLIAYRIFLAQPRVLRFTCSTSEGATLVHVHQSDDVSPLAVDLSLLLADPSGEPSSR